MARSKILSAVAALAYFGLVPPSGAMEYTITDLGTLPGGSYSLGLGINNSGQVSGYTTFTSGSSTGSVWNGTTPTTLGVLPRCHRHSQYRNQ